MEQLKVDIDDIDQIVISHNHHDHTGGLLGVLEKNHEVTVFLPKDFPQYFKDKVLKSGAAIKEVGGPAEICSDVYTTGQMGNRIKEQSLIIETPKGPVVITGCAHQGVVNILQRTKEIIDDPVFLIFGGFHLNDKSDDELKKTVVQFKKFGVKYCGPTHCSGKNAINTFKEVYERKYIYIGTGKTLEIYGG